MGRGVVVAVKDVTQAQGHVPLRLVVQQCSVHGGVGRHHHDVVQRGVTLIHIVGAHAHTPVLGQRAYQPQVGAGARGQGRGLAFVGHTIGAVGGLDDFGIEEGKAAIDLPLVRQLPAHGRFETVGTLLTGQHQLRRVGRVGGFHVGTFQAEQGRGHRQAAVEQVPLGADFVVGGLFRFQALVAGTEGEDLRRRLVGTADRHVVGLDRVRLVDQADARAPGGVGARQLGAAQVVGVLLVKHVVTHPEQGLPLRRQLNQVLYVETCDVLGGGALGGLAVGLERHIDQAVTEHRDLGHVVLAEHALVLDLPAELHTVQQVVVHAGQQRLLLELGLVEPAVFTALHVAAVELDQQFTIGGGDEAGRAGVRQGVVAVQVVVVVTAGIAQGEVVIDPVVDTGAEGKHLAAGVIVIRVGGAEALVAIDIDRAVAQGRNAEVDQALVVQVGRAQVQFQVIGQLEIGRGCQGLAVDVAIVTEGVAVFQGAGQTKGLITLLLVGPAGIELGTALALAVEADAHFLHRAEGGFLAHAVDQAARGAAAIEHGRRALDHLDPLDIGQIAVIQGVVTHAIDIHVANGTETANRHLVTLAVAVGQANPRHVLEHVLHRLRALILDHARWHDVDGLRDVTQRRVDFQSTPAFAGLVALFFIVAVDRGCRNSQGFGVQRWSDQHAEHGERGRVNARKSHHAFLFL